MGMILGEGILWKSIYLNFLTLGNMLCGMNRSCCNFWYNLNSTVVYRHVEDFSGRRIDHFRWCIINTRKVHQKFNCTEKLLNQRMARGYVTLKFIAHRSPDRSLYLAYNLLEFIWTPFLWLQWDEGGISSKQIQCVNTSKICLVCRSWLRSTCIGPRDL